MSSYVIPFLFLLPVLKKIHLFVLHKPKFTHGGPKTTMGVSSFFPCMCSQEFNPGSTLSYGVISLDNSYFSLKLSFFLVLIFSHMIYMKAGSGLSFPFHISRAKQAYYRHSKYASMIHWLSEYTRYLLGIPEVQMPAMFIYLFTLSRLFI